MCGILRALGLKIRYLSSCVCVPAITSRLLALVIGVSGTQSEGTMVVSHVTGQPMRSVCQMVCSVDCGFLAKISSKKKRADLERRVRAAACAIGLSNTKRRNSGIVRAM